jgi:hypothetical protein
MRRVMSSWVVWLGLVAVTASGLTVFAQGQRRPGQEPPRMITGNDVGFRVDGTDSRGRLTGTWMVRVGGEWVEAGAGGVVRPVK